MILEFGKPTLFEKHHDILIFQKQRALPDGTIGFTSPPKEGVLHDATINLRNIRATVFGQNLFCQESNWDKETQRLGQGMYRDAN